MLENSHQRHQPFKLLYVWYEDRNSSTQSWNQEFQTFANDDLNIMLPAFSKDILFVLMMISFPYYGFRIGASIPNRSPCYVRMVWYRFSYHATAI